MNKAERDQIFQFMTIAADQGLDMSYRQLAVLRAMQIHQAAIRDDVSTTRSRVGWIMFMVVVLPLILAGCSLFGLV